MSRGKQAPHECNRLPGNDDHHSATSGEGGNLRLASILPPKSVQVIPEHRWRATTSSIAITVETGHYGNRGGACL